MFIEVVWLAICNKWFDDMLDIEFDISFVFVRVFWIFQIEAIRIDTI